MHQKNRARKGSSLVIVVCVSAFLMAFALAIVYSSGLLLSRANRRLEQERCYRLAQSFAGTLDDELKKYSNPKIALVDPQSAPENSFYRYEYQFLEGEYGEFDPDHPDETIFHYTAASPDSVDTGKYGEIRVALYKEADQNQDDAMSGELVEGAGVDDIMNAGIIRYIFTVEVTADLDGVSYSYSTEYRQMATYDVRFTHNGTNIFWKDNQWHTNHQDGSEYSVDWNLGNIQYEYQSDSNNITRCVFENAYEEGGAHEEP